MTVGNVPVWLLFSAAILVGTSSAFYIPSSGTIPRRLVAGEQLGRAMAARQIAGQLVAALGAPLGGLVVVLAGLGGAAALNSASFAVIFVLQRC
jgi:MFS family permease